MRKKNPKCRTKACDLPPNPVDPSIYENTRGWLRVLTLLSKQPPLWIPVSCEPTYSCGRMDLIVTPEVGLGRQKVWRTRVWFEDEALNLCPDRPPQELLDAYYEAKRKAQIVEEEDEEN